MLPFRHPSTILIAGPTGCGKTQFLVQLLTASSATISPPPERIVWVYGEWQSAYEELQARLGPDRIAFATNCNMEELYNTLNPQVRNLIVLDDQMESDTVRRSSASAASLAKFFTQGSHHRNLTVIYIVQNLFNQDKMMRTVSLNAHYLLLFKNPRDKSQIRTLAQQMYPTRVSFLIDAFNDATTEAYGYLLLDLRPETPDELRVRTNVIPPQQMRIYTPFE